METLLLYIVLQSPGQKPCRNQADGVGPGREAQAWTWPHPSTPFIGSSYTSSRHWHQQCGLSGTPAELRERTQSIVPAWGRYSQGSTAITAASLLPLQHLVLTTDPCLARCEPLRSSPLSQPSGWSPGSSVTWNLAGPGTKALFKGFSISNCSVLTGIA